MPLGMDHIGVVVADLDAALQQFSTQFGWQQTGPVENLDHIGVKVAYLASDLDGTLIQFVCPIAPGPLRDHLEAHGDGLHHLCFAVPDVRTTVEALAPKSDSRIVRGGRGRLACFLPEPSSGVRIELTEINASFGGFDGEA